MNSAIGRIMGGVVRTEEPDAFRHAARLTDKDLEDWAIREGIPEEKRQNWINIQKLLQELFGT